MQYRSRQIQARGPVQARYNIFKVTDALNDSIFDGVILPKTSVAVKWIKENTIHEALKITTNALSSGPFLSTQVSAVRDEIREITFVVTQEINGIFLTSVKDVAIIERARIAEGITTRHSIAIRKYDGRPIVIYAKDSEIIVDGRVINTSCRRPDFPSISIDQPPIGNDSPDKPLTGAISYKCRESGQIFARIFDPMTMVMGPEIVVDITGSIGGADVVAFGGNLNVRVDKLENGSVIPYIGRQTINTIKSSIKLEILDLSGIPFDNIELSMTQSFIDHTGAYHCPVVVRMGEKFELLDVMPEDDLAVAALSLSKQISAASLTAFPKKPGIVQSIRPGFGDGFTDGNGVIASVSAYGDLYSSNSQAGGYFYPNHSLLNHDMPKIFTFRTTQCYTRGSAPNTVSMDYVFIEADDEGDPLDNIIWLETWDMPLPPVELSAAVSGNVIHLKISANGWFTPANSTFWIADQKAKITSVSLTGERTVELTTDRPVQSGTEVGFETRTKYFHHAGSALAR